MIDDQQLVAQKPDVNYGTLSEQPSPEEFFLLSRVTGVVTVASLCTASGLGREKTLAAIEKLLRVGLLHVVDKDGNPTGAGSTETAAPAQPLEVSGNARFNDGGVDNSAMLGEPPSLEMNVDDLGSEESDLFGPSSNEAEQQSPPSRESGQRAADRLAAGPPIDTGRYSNASAFESDTGSAFDAGGGIFDGGDSSNSTQKSFDSGGSSFDTGGSFDAGGGGDDDDLFMPSSPAHVSRIEGRAPVKRSHSEARAEGAKSRPAERQPEPKVKEETSGDRPYPNFPVDFTTWEVDESQYVEGVDRDLQREVLFVHAHLDDIDFYELFGVSHDADRRAIKKTYFAMSKRFHPDKFFREEVGDLAGKVEDIFKFVTKGYQTLTKKNKRAEYDQALSAARAQQQHQVENDERKREMAAEMLRKRASQLEQQGKFAEAADQQRKVAALMRDPQALLEAASLLLRANQRLDEAAKLARGVAGRLPQAVEPRLVLGQIYEKNQMFEEAAAAFAEAESLAPGDPSVKVHLERVKSQLG